MLAATVVVATTSPGASPDQYLLGQVIAVAIALLALVGTLRGHRATRATKGDELAEARRARLEQSIVDELARAKAEIARLDGELAEAYTEVGALRVENRQQFRLVRAYERKLHELGINPDDGLNDGGGGTR